MRYPREELDAYRKSAGELENELIDEYRDGTVTRHELLRRGSVLGMSIPLLSLVAGVPLAVAAPQRAERSTAGTLRVGSPPADGSLEPPLLQSLGALAVSHMAGEQLVFADKSSRLVPRIATSWKSSNKAKTWTFQIRKNVKFHDGTPLTADDVVATFKRLLTKDSQAQSSYKGVIVGVKKTGTHTVEFDLDGVERVLPVRAEPADLPGDHPAEDVQAPLRPLQAGRVDVEDERHRAVPAQGEPRRGRADVRGQPELLGRQAVDRRGRVADPRGPGARDGAPERPDRSRRAAHLPGRPAGRIEGDRTADADAPLPAHEHEEGAVQRRARAPGVRARAQPAADRPGPLGQVRRGRRTTARCGRATRSPTSRCRSASRTSPRRRRCSRPRARRTSRSRSAATGRSRCPTTPSAWRRRSRRSASTARSRCTRARSTSTASASAPPGKLAPWLGVDFGIVDYGARATPLTYLNAALKSGGVWNAARYANKKFDRMIESFEASPTLAAQKKFARQMQQQLLKDTPAIYAYFYSYIAGTSPEGEGLRARRHLRRQPPRRDARVRSSGSRPSRPAPHVQRTPWPATRSTGSRSASSRSSC